MTSRNKPDIHSIDQPPLDVRTYNFSLRREKTDPSCFSCFAIFNLLFVVLMVVRSKDVSTLGLPKDSNSQSCGVGEAKEYPYLYFVAPAIKTELRTVCVKACPNEKGV
jgi:hypothetical protein